MAEFLTTVATSYQIENIIKDAEECLILISPYLKINNTLYERLLDADKRGVIITLIYGKKEISNSEKEKLKKICNLNLHYISNLHAKCYCNENKAIISSMNLYEFSERNNREMSILINRFKERKLYKEISNEIESIKNNSDIIREINRNKKEVGIKSGSDLSNYDKIRIFNEKFKSYFCEKYSVSNIMHTNEGIDLIVYDFPFENVKLECGIILKFSFDLSPDLLKILKDQFRDELRLLLKEYRCYWNGYRYDIRIYPDKNNKFSLANMNSSNVDSHIEYCMNAVDITRRFLIKNESFFN
ncbi:phospholipase D family protein [Halonatronum saccharophilum]|uniref:phospholipase D family protein n=1 Tax=Halonatronum saccharophilum TaxID=150060 RepID=UPI0004B9C70E|nr:phospholipase D family protein [Halonatronum saccharophilum]